MFDILQTETFAKWRSKLKDDVARAAIALRIARLELGQIGDAKPVGDGVSELRIHYGPGYRIYFHRRGQTIIVLLCGGNKTTQAKDIQKAKLLAKEGTE
jgi:putative addiction module killer protein